MAPHPWDKKYVRQTSNTGMEVALVRRGPTNSGTWIVLQPDKQLRSLRLNDRQTVLSQAPTGTYFRPLGKLTDAQKKAVKEAADQALRSEETVPKMIQRFEGEVSGSRRFFALLSAAPALGGKTIRWITRSRYRVMGFGVALFLIFEALQTLLVFEMMEHWAQTIRYKAKEGIENILAWSENLKETAEWLVEQYARLSEYISGPRLCGYILVLVFLVYQWWHYDSEESEDSEHSSQCSSPEETPPQTPRDQSTREQMMLVEKLAKRQEELHDQIIQDEAKAQAREMVQKVRQESAGSSWTTKDWKSFEEMSAKLESFQKILEEDQKKRKPEASQEEDQSVPGTPMAKGETAKKTPEKNRPEGPEPKKVKTDVSASVQRLKRLSQNPTAIFSEALEHMEDWEEEFFLEHFPPGYRARVAPDVFTNIYSHGKRAKEYFMDWLRSRGLMECNAARELIACGDVLDTLLIDEPLDNFINKLQVEKLGKKIYGLQKAFENVNQESHWKKPTGAAKQWTSRVNWEAAKQVDPELLMPNQVPRIRQQEDETRMEMDREAMIIRTQQRLRDAAAGKGES